MTMAGDPSAFGGADEEITSRVLRALGRNRTPGFHFPGHFLGLIWESVGPGTARLRLPAGLHCTDSRGRVEIGALAVLADTALATSIRTRLSPVCRLATVSMHLQCTGLPPSGDLLAEAHFPGFGGDPDVPALAQAVIHGDAGPVCYVSGRFLTASPPPGFVMAELPWRQQDTRQEALADPSDLTPEEQTVVRRAGAATAALRLGSSFLAHFWGYTPVSDPAESTCLMPVGLHVANRVGHVQGGILCGLAAVTAGSALPEHEQLLELSAQFLAAGKGSVLRAQAKVLHAGRRLGRSRVVVADERGRQVLEASTCHIRAGNTQVPAPG